jgi:hypothetical protein
MSPKENAATARMLRALADEIEAGDWLSVSAEWRAETALRPHYSGRPRGREIVGKYVTIDLLHPNRERRTP